MSTRFFGQYLLEKGRITSQQLLDALECQKEITEAIGVMALERGFLTTEQIKHVQQQKKTNQRFGEIAVALGFLTQARLDELLDEQDTSHRVRLGEALVSKGYITLEILEKELKEYNKESEKFASEVSAAFSNIAHKHIVKTFTDLMLVMFTRFGKQDIIIERCETGKEKVRLFRWVISQKIAGQEAEFNCLLSVPPKLLLQMASTMLDEHISTADELALDATKEFVNIANGTACAKLSEEGVNLKLMPPEVYETTTTPYPINAKDVVCVHLASPDSKLEVAFEF
ncbi:MAG TPA: chemotaxis protein CheX [Candidatus Binatia bacterium]|jgi:CheY-specific phosphatase CheX|nr:chemotaxis protein CheX [Candidatus Binatia bacterium]